MVVMTVRVPRTLRERMKHHKHINWSAVVREAVERRLKQEERVRAAAVLDEVRSRVKRLRKGELLEWLREDRRR